MARRIAALTCISSSVVPGYWYGTDVGTAASLVHTAPLVDWAYLTTPQTALENTVYHYPRGRCLGGTYVGPPQPSAQ